MEGSPGERPSQSGWYSGTQVVDFSKPVPSLQPIEWSASEYIAHQKGSSWFMLLGVAAAIVSLVVFFVTHSLVSTLIVVVMFAVTGVYAVRQPATKRYRISEDGVRVDAKFYPYSTFRSFSVMNEGAVNCVWLRPLQRYLPTIAMYFSDQDERSIVMTLENYLPAEDRSLDIVDRVLRKIRF